jgi:cytochrome c peroxidase
MSVHPPRGPRVAARLAALRGAVAALLVAACGADDGSAPDGAEVRAQLAAAGIATPAERVAAPEAVLALGEALFFDAELSGNRDIACATCHAPAFAASDGISLAIGTGGRGVGPNRVPGLRRRLMPRNTLDLAGRAAPDFVRLGWDGAYERRDDGTVSAPREYAQELPPGLSGPLAAASYLPPFERDRMRGRPGDTDVDGGPNEIAMVDEFDLPGLDAALMARLLALEGYRVLFEQAWPDRDLEALTWVDGANALAAYIDTAFPDSGAPLDAFLAGDDDALGVGAHRGAAIFAGSGGCTRCHGGPFFTDHAFWNLGTPQLRPGMLDEEPLDYGRGRETGRADDRYRFRTPPLRNVALTGPWMHNGAYTTLEAAVAAHNDVFENVDTYDRTQLKPELQSLVLRDETTRARLRTTLAVDAEPARALRDDEIADVVAFLEALTSDAAAAGGPQPPGTVPSGRFGR